MTYFIAYDIASHKRRGKIAQILETYGIRVQYSFFQCDVPGKMLEMIIEKIRNEMDEKEDKIAVYYICDDCLEKAESLGNGDIYRPKMFKVV